jgi:hypothetical protein
LAQSHHIELGGVSTQGSLVVAQVFAPSQLRAAMIRKC